MACRPILHAARGSTGCKASPGRSQAKFAPRLVACWSSHIAGQRNRRSMEGRGAAVSRGGGLRLGSVFCRTLPEFAELIALSCFFVSSGSCAKSRVLGIRRLIGSSPQVRPVPEISIRPTPREVHYNHGFNSLECWVGRELPGEFDRAEKNFGRKLCLARVLGRTRTGPLAYSNSINAISGRDPIRIGGPHVPTPLEV
jgi:hypothetical protein